MKNIVFVIGTRSNQADFHIDTMTGQSLEFYNYPFSSADVYYENTKGLPEIYNDAINKYLNQDIVIVFAHDDIHIMDFFWANKLYEGLSKFDVVGVAGNKNRAKNQPSWAFKNTMGEWDDMENLSGVVGHGKKFPGDSIGIYGPCGEVEILDGVLIATTTDLLRREKIKFDSLFKFHFYDMDFCRTCKLHGLKIGTIPLSIMHGSKGNFANNSWLNSYKDYLSKWGD